jgi:hypothetical protein
MMRRLIFWRTSVMSALLGGSPVTKHGLRALVDTIHIDLSQKDRTKMEMEIDGAAKALDRSLIPVWTLARGTSPVTAWYT